MVTRAQRACPVFTPGVLALRARLEALHLLDLRQPPERFDLDLAHSLAGETEPAADLLERLRLGVDEAVTEDSSRKVLRTFRGVDRTGALRARVHWRLLKGSLPRRNACDECRKAALPPQPSLTIRPRRVFAAPPRGVDRRTAPANNHEWSRARSAPVRFSRPECLHFGRD